MGKVIGIDLGTTNSCVSVMEGGTAVVIPNAEGNRTTPSIVAFTKNGERLVGEPAKNQVITNPDRTIRSIKREMGTDFKVEIDGTKHTPQDISAMILQKIKADAEAYLGETVQDAVITVPAYFTDSQRQATKDAGRISGLNVLRIINEPTAASLAYGLDKENQHQKIMVFDLGGGTFDVSVLEIGDGVFDILIDYLAAEFKKENGVDLKADNMSLQRLKDAAEKAKKELSTAVNTNINLPFITANQSGPLHLNMDLSRSKFDELTHALVQKTVGPTKTALSDAGLNATEIDRVILVGGSTRIPAVQDAVKKITGKEPTKGVNPDECVALGAAIQGGVLSGEVKDLLLLDVTPLTLGIETLGNVTTTLIERNTTIPTRKSQVFTTAADNQTAVDVHVLQGERKMAQDNVTLGRFQLSGIPAARRGVPQVEVTFDIDANGIVNVSAKDLGTGIEQKITITASTNLSEDEIKAKVQEAELHAEEDKAKKEAVEVRNNAESLVYSTEKTLGEMKDKISEDEKKEVEEAVETLKKALESDDTENIKAESEKLTTAFYKISEKMYQQAPGAEGNPQPEQENSQDSNEDVVDADYEVVN